MLRVSVLITKHKKKVHSKNTLKILYHTIYKKIIDGYMYQKYIYCNFNVCRNHCLTK